MPLESGHDTWPRPSEHWQRASKLFRDESACRLHGLEADGTVISEPCLRMLLALQTRYSCRHEPGPGLIRSLPPMGVDLPPVRSAVSGVPAHRPRYSGRAAHDSQFEQASKGCWRGIK